jgi:M6 family metalloprotease-like protein
MKRFAKLLLTLLFGFQLLTLSAAWLNFEPQTITQPDGTVIHCFATGDEFYNWLHDENGFTIIRDHQSGYYVYADLINDELVATSYVLGQDDPAEMGLQPWMNIPAEKMQQRRADFLKNHMPDPTPIEGYSDPGRGSNVGTYNNLVVYVRFADQSEFTSDTTYYYDLFNNTTPGYNSMYNYYKEVSYEQLTMPSHFFPVPPQNIVISYQDIYPRAYFMPYDQNTNPEGYQENERAAREHKLLKRAVEYVAGQVPEDLDIDYNSDGYVDNVIFVVRGGTTAWSTLLWPHRWVLYTEQAYIHGKRVWDYNFNLESSVQNSGVGVLAHEMFHSLGAPDLYNYTSQPITPIGEWDLMAANQNPPQSTGAYMKYRYGLWIDDIPEITECGTYTLNPVILEDNNAFKIASPNSASEYFVVEYRHKIGTFESSLPTSGLLIYRVNTVADGQGNAQGPPNELYVYRPNGTNYVNGQLPQAAFAEDFNRTVFNDNSNPACFLSNDMPGGIDISNIGLIGETISFDVNFEKEPIADLAVSNHLITEDCSVDFYDLSLCYVDTWEWIFEGGTPATSTEQHPAGILYENAGTFDVTLKVTNQWGEHTVVFEDMIEVSTTILPDVNFMVSDTLACTDQIIQLTDLSEICPVAWHWEITPESFEFVGGTTADSQHPEVLFTDPGYYSIKLTVENSNGTSELLRQDYIQAGGVSMLEFDGSFEALSLSQHGWMVENPDDAVTWSLWNVNGSGNGTKAAGMNFYNYFVFNQRDQLISPPINLNATESWVLTFKHAYARVNPSFTDSLIVKISDDCGDTWTRLLTIADDGSGNFVTREPVGFEFIPILPEDWCGSGYGADCYSLDVTPWMGSRNVRIMFEAVNIVGNNLFIDDVGFDFAQNISGQGSTGSADRITIYPNPASDEVVVTANGINEQLDIQVFDMHGRLIASTFMDAGKVQSGETLRLDHLNKGMYFVQITGETVFETKKLIIR